MGWEDSSDGSERAGHRRPYLGRGLLAGGIGALLVAIALVASASAAGALGLGTAGARELAGALAGTGLAATLVGAVAVVPSERTRWYRALGGASLALLGVGAFLWAYPDRWVGDGVDLTLSVLAVYGLGVLVLGSYLLASVFDPAGRAGHRGTLAAAVPTVGDPAPTPAPDAPVTDAESGNGDAVNAGEARETGATDAERGGGEVLYERTSEPDGATGSGANGAVETQPTIDRIESNGEEFSWGGSGSRVESVDRPEPDGRTTVGEERSSAADGSEEASGEPGLGREHSNGSRERTSERGGERSLVALASDGAGKERSSTEKTGALGAANEPTGSTETNGAAAKEWRSSGEASGSGGSGPGGSTGRNRPSADGGVDTLQFGPSVDRYCGNCGHFQYVRTEDGIAPYCGYHGEVMEDMDPCLGWTSNS